MAQHITGERSWFKFDVNKKVLKSCFLFSYLHQTSTKQHYHFSDRTLTLVLPSLGLMPDVAIPKNKITV
jgi:hypothetical protein